MQSFIILGSEASQSTHIEAFITQQNIDHYNITRLEGTVKIADVHAVVRSAHVHLGKNQKRLIIFSGDITIPAQNALLKFIEELSADTFVFFLVPSKDILLETITSRCSVVTLRSDTKVITDDYHQIINTIIHTRDHAAALLLLAESVSTVREYEQFILKLRQEVLHSFLTNNNSESHFLISLLRHVNEQYRFVKENNVNPKFTIETSIL